MHSDFIFLNYVHIPSSLGSNQNFRSVKIYYNFNMYYLHQHITVLRVHAVLKQDHSSIAWTPMSSTTWFIYFLGGRMWICCLTVLTIHFIYQIYCPFLFMSPMLTDKGTKNIFVRMLLHKFNCNLPKSYSGMLAWKSGPTFIWLKYKKESNTHN